MYGHVDIHPHVCNICIFLVTSPLWDICFANTFSQSWAFLSMFTTVFRRAGVFNFEEFNLLILSFWKHALCIKYKRTLPSSRSQRFSPVFSLWSFIGLCFRFQSVINFELIFVWCKVWSKVQGVFSSCRNTVTTLSSYCSFIINFEVMWC